MIGELTIILIIIIILEINVASSYSTVIERRSIYCSKTPI